MTKEIVQQVQFWLLVVATVLGIIDLSLSRQRRIMLRERLSDWWLRLEYTPLVELLAQVARSLERTYQKVFGPRPFTLRFLLRGMAWGVAIAFGVAFYFFHRTGLSSTNVTASFANMVVPSAVLSWLSLVITIKLLAMLGSASNLGRIVVLTAVDLALALGIAFLFAGAVIAAENVTGLHVILTPDDLVFASGLPVADEDVDTPVVIAGFDGGSWLAAVVAPASSVVASLLVAFLHVLPQLLLSVFVLITKSLHPIWKPVVSWMILRLEESPRGVIAALAAAVAVASELFVRFADAYFY